MAKEASHVRTREGLERSPATRARAHSSDGRDLRFAPRADSVVGYMAFSSMFIAPRRRPRAVVNLAGVRADGYAALADDLDEGGAAGTPAPASAYGLRWALRRARARASSWGVRGA